MALGLYETDYGAYPIGYSSAFVPSSDWNTDPITYPMSWFELMYPYTVDRWAAFNWFVNGTNAVAGGVEGAKGMGIWSCPSLAYVEIGWPYQFGGYGYNAGGCGQSPQGPGGRTLGLAGNLITTTSPSFGRTSFPTRTGDVSAPAMMLAMGDVDAMVLEPNAGYTPPCPTIVIDKSWGPVSVTGWIAAGIMLDQPNNRVLQKWRGAIGRRHGGRWQVLFCDGHVGKVKINDLFDIRNPQVRSRWNKDNAPHPEIQLQIDPNAD